MNCRNRIISVSLHFLVSEKDDYGNELYIQRYFK